MIQVTYQSALGGVNAAGTGVYVRLGDAAVRTRRRDASREVTVSLAKTQSRWLKEVTELSGPDIDGSAVVRALIDLGMELEIDWPVIASGTALRSAVRESVMVRRRATG